MGVGPLRGISGGVSAPGSTRPAVNLMAEPGFGAAGRALMEAVAMHQQAQREAAGYRHPPTHPPAHMVGRPGEPVINPGGPMIPARRRGGPIARANPLPSGGGMQMPPALANMILRGR